MFSSRIRRLGTVIFLLVIAGFRWRATAQQPPEPALHISVADESQKPVSGALIEATADSTVVCRAFTDLHGQAILHDCGAAVQLHLTATCQGYLSATADVSLDSDAVVEFVLSRLSVENVEVHAEVPNPVVEAAPSEAQIPVEGAKLSPLRPSTLNEALPLIPGVIRTTDGRVQISGLNEEHSSLSINSVTVNDPATGSFGLSVPVDSVETLKVMQSPYLAQYGSFIAGVVSAETRRGGDKWTYSLNDPLPEFRIRSGHLVGVRDATPRLNFSGPLLAARLYLVEGFEYLLHKAEVRALPFPLNESRSTALNSFTQMDALLGARNSITATFHLAPHSLRYANLNYFDPEPVTPDARYHEDTGTISDRLGFGKGLITSSFSGTRVSGGIAGQGQEEMMLSPLGNSGNYFGQQNREAKRLQWTETWNPGDFVWNGDHSVQIGTVLAHAADDGRIRGRTTQVVDRSGNLFRTISFDGDGVYRISDFEPAAYAQDHWVIDSRLSFDLGLRWEKQSLTNTNRFAPRGGFTWIPLPNDPTVVRGGVGIFYDAVPLDTYAFSAYPEQIVTTYDGNGHIIDGPRRYLNVTSVAVESGFPFISRQLRQGDFAPYSIAWNLEAERTLKGALMLRVRYLHTDAQNQLTLTPEVTADQSALVLDSRGGLRNRQIDFTARAGANKQRQLFFSYVRQFARGDLSDAGNYLGDFPFPVVRAPILASTAGEIPNRFLLWGLISVPRRIRITPHLEYRNGFTWQPVDQMQDFITPAPSPQPRYPRYFSADMRVAKDLNVGPHHAIRLSVTGRNLSNHDNPLQIHNNVADPAYGMFFGNYNRHYSADFDFLF